jgi:hypothetical protein
MHGCACEWFDLGFFLTISFRPQETPVIDNIKLVFTLMTVRVRYIYVFWRSRMFLELVNKLLNNFQNKTISKVSLSNS